VKANIFQALVSEPSGSLLPCMPKKAEKKSPSSSFLTHSQVSTCQAEIHTALSPAQPLAAFEGGVLSQWAREIDRFLKINTMM